MKDVFECFMVCVFLVLGIATVCFIKEILCQYENMRFSIIAGQCVVKESK